MPLLDHFRSPLHPKHRWNAFHSGWAHTIKVTLNEDLLPDGYFAEGTTSAGSQIEIDVATYSEDSAEAETASVATQVYAPPAATMIVPAAFPDAFEVRIFYEEGGAKLVAAIELISPSNKDRARHRRAFAAKCAGYLSQGISLIIVDVVTSRRSNLHREILSILNCDEHASDAELYASAYRPVIREGEELIEIWTSDLALGETLPIMPLWLNAAVCLPIDLEETHSSTCRTGRIS